VRLYDHLAVVDPGLALDRRAALAAAARSRGVETSVDEPLSEARGRLAALEEPVPSRAEARRAVAAAESELDARRERVATLRGRLEAGEDAEAAYREAVRTLSEVETDYHAAVERLTAARERARSARDSRERRLRLQDRVGNLERTARQELVSAIRPTADDAVADAPDAEAASYAEAAPVTAALALVRVGVVRPPVVLACRRFPDASTAEAWLGSPVIRL
jgi:chromosome segregation ATPase